MENKFAENLSKLRKFHRLSREELAEKIGVSGRTIFQYESGFNEPDINTLIKLAGVLGVSLDELVCGGDVEVTVSRDVKTLDARLVEQCLLASKTIQTLCEKLVPQQD